MPERAVRVTLDIAGSAPTEAIGTFDEFTLAQQFTRAGKILGAAIGITIPLLFIPIIHLLAPPALLITGLVLAAMQFTYVGRLSAIKVPCPRCGEPNQIGGGLGRRSIAPQERACESCRRTLILTIVPIDNSQVPAERTGTS